MDPKPSEEYIFDDVEVADGNPVRGIAKSAEARIRMITKSSVQAYIDSFLGEKGLRRKQVEFTAPFTIQYFTNMSGSIKDDPTVFNIQLSRVSQILRQKSTSIIIADTGFEWENSGLGGFDRGIRSNDNQLVLRLPTLAKVTMDIMVVSQDETTTGDLSDVLVHIFGPLTALNRSWWIRSFNPSDKWEIRLPLNGPSPTGLERRNITEDPKDSLWSTGLSLTVDFEGMVQIGVDNSLNELQCQAIGINLSPNNSSFAFQQDEHPEDAFADFDVPEEVTLGQPFQLQVRTLPGFAFLYSDTPSVALVDEKLIVHPKRLGEFNLVLASQKAGASDEVQDPSGPKQGTRLLEKHKIKVTFLAFLSKEITHMSSIVKKLLVAARKSEDAGADALSLAISRVGREVAAATTSDLEEKIDSWDEFAAWWSKNKSKTLIYSLEDTLGADNENVARLKEILKQDEALEDALHEVYLNMKGKKDGLLDDVSKTTKAKSEPEEAGETSEAPEASDDLEDSDKKSGAEPESSEEPEASDELPDLEDSTEKK